MAKTNMALAAVREAIYTPSTGAEAVAAARAVDGPALEDQIAQTEGLYDRRDEPALPDADAAAEQALTTPVGKPVFNTHSQAFVGRLMAEERSLKETAGNLRSKIDELEAEYTDVMLAESGVSAAIQAIKRGQE